MTLLIIFVCAAFAVTALYFAIAPFLASREAQARAELLDEELKRVEHLVARKSMLLASLRELEFEHETQKIADDDYERFRAKMERQAVAIMRELDRIHGGRGWQDTIDAEVNARLKAEGFDVEAEEAPDTEDSGVDESPESPESPAATEETVEAQTETDETDETGGTDDADVEASEVDAETCAKCGEPLEANDKFCSQCGHPVAAPAPAPADEAPVKEASA